MAIQSLDYRRHVRRPLGFIVIGVLLLAAALFCVYDAMHRRSQVQPTEATYHYKITQSVDKSVTYFPNSFYANGPGTNTAYVMSLTDNIKTTFHYRYTGSDVRELAYAYEVRAMVQGTFSADGSEGGAATVWSKEYPLLEPQHGIVSTQSLAFDPAVTVPFSEYQKQIDQLRAAYTLPILSKITVMFTINVSGVVDGTPFNDFRTASVTAPLSQQLFSLNQKYDKEDAKQIVTASSQASVDRTAQLELYAAGLFGLLAMGSFVYGLRRQIFKTPYQRELDKIYRYHEGIIIRASHPTDFTGKHIVQLKSFDDMLNLEEELKVPIVAMPAGVETTQFTIIRDDVVYLYTLGRTPKRNEQSLEQLEERLNRRFLKARKASKKPPISR